MWMIFKNYFGFINAALVEELNKLDLVILYKNYFAISLLFFFVIYIMEQRVHKYYKRNEL